MRKRITIILFMLVAVAIQGMAQLRQQLRQIPNYTKIVEIKDGANKRKEPKTTSPKLMCDSKGNYTWRPSGGEVHPANFQVNYLWVTDETAEWYHGYYGDYPDNMILVYVSKKAVKAKRPLINRAYTEKCSFDVKYTERNSGKYKGYCIISSSECQWGEYDYFGKFLFIGKNINGVCHGKCFSTEGNNNGWAKLPSSFDTNRVLSLTDSEIDQMISSAPRGTVVLLPASIFCYHPGDQYYWDTFKDFYFPDTELPR